MVEPFIVQENDFHIAQQTASAEKTECVRLWGQWGGQFEQTFLKTEFVRLWGQSVGRTA